MRFHAKYDQEQNGTEVHPSGTFYFDTLRMSSLYLWREFGDLRSEMGFFPLVWGTLSVRGA